MYEGVKGLVTQPMNSLQHQNGLRAFSGVGTGILSGLSKTISGDFAFSIVVSVATDILG